MLQNKFQISAEQAAEKCAQLSAVGESCGLKMDFDKAHYGNTFLAHQLQQYANTLDADIANKVHQALFDAVLEQGLNIGDVNVLVNLAQAQGLDAAMVKNVLETQRFANAVRIDETAAAELNVSGVPFFGFDGRLAVAGAQSIDAFKEVINHILNKDASEDALLSRQ